MKKKSLARIPIASTTGTTSSREVRVCIKTFSLETIKATCYRFAASGYHSLSVDESSGQAVVTFCFPEGMSEEVEEHRVDEFQQALLDQDLRRIVSERTTLVRQLILANAFADTMIVDKRDD